jgi:hypothetical protein
VSTAALVDVLMMYAFVSLAVDLMKFDLSTRVRGGKDLDRDRDK